MSPLASASVQPKRKIHNSSLQALSSRPEKRARRPQARKHADYYLEDGNVIIIMLGIRYRLHRSVLSMHSTFFRNLLSNRDGHAEDVETEDGCPLVRLEGDAIWDSCFTWLVEIMYKGVTNEYMNPCETHTLSQINFLLWLGFTYGVDYIVKHARRTLTLVFPSGRLEDWKPLRKTVKIVKLSMFEGEREDLAECINVLRKLRRMQHVLPVIFYAYCQLVPIAAIAAQYTEEKEEYHLSDEDLVTCLKAIPKLVEHKRKVLDAFTDKSIAANCEDENQCRAAFARIRKALKGAESPDALEDLSPK